MYSVTRDLNEKAIQKICSLIAEWSVNSDDDGTTTLWKEGMGNHINDQFCHLYVDSIY